MTASPELPSVGPWARDKLERLRKYLSAYTTIMRRQQWVRGYVYVDAFAGAGQAIVRDRHDSEKDASAALDFGDQIGALIIRLLPALIVLRGKREEAG